MPHCTAAAAPLVVGKALRALLPHITCKGDAAHSGKEQPSSATGKLKAESTIFLKNNTCIRNEQDDCAIGRQ